MINVSYVALHQDLRGTSSFMLITLPFRYLFEALKEAPKLVAAAITHGTKNTIQSGIEFNPVTTRPYLNALR